MVLKLLLDTATGVDCVQEIKKKKVPMMKKELAILIKKSILLPKLNQFEL